MVNTINPGSKIMTNMTSWLPVAPDSDFSIYNLPYGVFSTPGRDRRLGVAIGDQVIDLAAVAELGLFDDLCPARSVFRQAFLNDYMRLGKATTSAIRQRLQQWLQDEDSPLREHTTVLVPQAKVQMHLPVQIGDYTDFYSSRDHATNVGKMFRDPENALLPNWLHLPVAYHGRSSSIVVSGTPIHRPQGQVMRPDADRPELAVSERLDFELEMGFIIGKDSKLGQSISTNESENYIFGLALFNDWSARDIQKWEYVPLGPFLGKNFASSLAAWIVPLEALDPYRMAGPEQEPAVLPYLQCVGRKHYDVHLEVSLITPEGVETVISRSNFRHMYWSMAQQLAHHTVNGCNVRVGDLMASGTISGPEPGSYGSMLELSWAGQRPVRLNDGSERKFIQDKDTVILRGYAGAEGRRVGFGEVHTQVLRH